MIRRWMRRALLGIALSATATVALALTARLLDGPIFVFPGGRLVEGRRVEFAAVDWTALAGVREIEFQLESPARSRTTRMTIHQGTPYVPCAFCTNELLKRWTRELELDDRVVMRVDGLLIEGRARRVPQDSEEYRSTRRAHLAKYADPKEPRNVVEDGAARWVVGAGQASPGHDGSARTDSWMYRIDPR